MTRDVLAKELMNWQQSVLRVRRSGPVDLDTYNLLLPVDRALTEAFSTGSALLRFTHQSERCHLSRNPKTRNELVKRLTEWRMAVLWSYDNELLTTDISNLLSTADTILSDTLGLYPLFSRPDRVIGSRVCRIRCKNCGSILEHVFNTPYDDTASEMICQCGRVALVPAPLLYVVLGYRTDYEDTSEPFNKGE